MHQVIFEIDPARFEQLNREASEQGFVSVRAYLESKLLSEAKPPKMKTKSVVDSGEKGA